MQYDLNKQIEMCKNLQRMTERVNKGIVRLILYYFFKLLILQREKFDSATYEINRQKEEKN